MKFNLNVKPLKDAMDLAIISGNISKFFEKSTVIELTVSDDILRLNTQATSLVSEATIKGYNEDKGVASAIVDCQLFKQLVSTIDGNEVCLDFQDNFLVVQYGKSKFNVPKLLSDEDEASLDRPALEESLKGSLKTELHPDNWKYIQDHQLYAVAMSQIHKVYTRVWVDADKGVLTGDPNLGFFTYQPESDLSGSCLVSSTIVNLLSVLEDGSSVYSVDDSSYVVCMSCDSFDFRSQFTVEHEEQNGMGSYDSDMIFAMVLDNSNEPVKLSKSKLASTVKQAGLFASASDPLIYITASESGFKLENDNVNCVICKDASNLNYSIAFTVSDLETTVSHMDDDDLYMSPIVKEGEVFGVRFSSGKLIALLGGVE